MEWSTPSFVLKDLGDVNIVLGKNGCGKSRLLRELDAQLETEDIGKKKYVTPERGGVHLYEAHIEQNIVASPDWMPNARRVNQFPQFKQQSVVQFRRLETTVLREAEARKEVGSFDPYVEKLNALLDNIELKRADPAFKLYELREGSEIPPAEISSGESELIALGIEILMFSKDLERGKMNLLLLDEPDVHLHPDLQSRFVAFLMSLVREHDFKVLIATHSTAILGALSDYEEARVAFMKAGDTRLEFEPISEVLRRILPVFGAHPLSNVFNEVPILLLEGEDDERVWQQAIRSSEQRLGVYPVACGGVGFISLYEREVERIVNAVYDNPKAFSLRDGDGTGEDIDDLGVVTRFRLRCHAAENLLLANEVLEFNGLSFEDVKSRCSEWLAANEDHVKFSAMQAFSDSGYDRIAQDLKEIRTILAGQIMGSSKSWEVLVGQALGQFTPPASGEAVDAGSLAHFLGEKILDHLIRA